MKKPLATMLAIIMFLGCNQDQIDNLTSENSELTSERDSLDMAMGVALEYFGEISRNLQEIKKKENIITISAQENVEFQQTEQEQILADIQDINNLMEKNRQTINSLRDKLDLAIKKAEKSSYDHAQALKNIKLLQEQILTLETQIAEKDQEIESLKEVLAQRDLKIEELNLVTWEQGVEIAAKTEKLNEAWYVLGTSKELKDQKVITKEGGLFGMGGSKKLMQDFNREYFTRVDITKTSEIPVIAKKANFVTSHPSDSYEWVEGDSGIEKVVIKDASQFWSASKFMVIVVVN